MAHKYRAVRTELDGISFDSKAEANRYAELKLMQQAGAIDFLAHHPSYPILINRVPVCKVELDFIYRDNETGQDVLEDVKGMDTPMSKLKRKMFEAAYGHVVRVIKKR